MTYLVSHQHNGAPVTTAHETEQAAEVEARRVSASLPVGATVVWWFVEGAEACRTGAVSDSRAGLAPESTRCAERPKWNDPIEQGGAK